MVAKGKGYYPQTVAKGKGDKVISLATAGVAADRAPTGEGTGSDRTVASPVTGIPPETENYAVEIFYGDHPEPKDYVEIWSGYPVGGNVVKAVEQRGGQAVGIGWNSGYDLERDDVKKYVRQQLEHEWRPKTLMLCPMCTPSVHGVA